MRIGSMRTVALAALLVIGAVALAGCSLSGSSKATPTPNPAESWNNIKSAGKMVVGTAAGYEPFEYYDSKNQLDGFDIALMNEIGKQLGVTIEWKDYAFKDLGNALATNNIDAAIAAISITPERAAKVDFSRPYFAGNSAALAASDSAIQKIETAAQFAGQTVGVEKGSIYETWAQDNLVAKGVIPNRNLQVYPDIAQAIKDLKRSRVGVVIEDAAPAKEEVTSGGVKIVGTALDSQLYGIAMKPGATFLQRNLDAAIQTLSDNGTINKLAQQYLGLSAHCCTAAADARSGRADGDQGAQCQAHSDDGDELYRSAHLHIGSQLP